MKKSESVSEKYKVKISLFYALIITLVKPLYSCEIYDELSSGVLYYQK